MIMQLVEPYVDLLNDEKLADLLTPHDSLCVSIYMPTHRTSPEREQDPIRLKNLLSDAEDQLSEHGLSKDAIHALLAPARRYIQQEEQDFWRYQSNGLAIFLTEDNAYIYRLPHSFKEQVYVNQHFYVKSLLPVLDNQQRFYVLSLSQKNIRLFEGTRFELGEFDLSAIPTNFEDWMEKGEFVGGLQFHSGGGSGKQPIFHGGADHQNAQHQALVEFLRKIENYVTPILQNQQAPLILAGSEVLQGIYRNINDYGDLSEVGITTNPDVLSDDELHEHAWALIEPKLSHTRAQSLGLYAQLAGKADKRAVNEIDKIIPAAFFQRVDTLFVANNKEVWGHFDKNEQTVTVHDAPQNGNDELVNLAVTHTLLNGGNVFVMDEMPEDEALQAILRY